MHRPKSLAGQRVVTALGQMRQHRGQEAKRPPGPEGEREPLQGWGQGRLSQGSRDSKCKGPEVARGTRASSFMPWPRGPALRRACAWVHDLPLWAGNSLVFEQGVWRFCPPLGPVNSVAGARGMSNDVGLWGVGGDLGFYSQRGREAEALDRAGPAGILIGSVLLPCGAQAPKKLVKECAVNPAKAKGNLLITTTIAIIISSAACV